MTAIHVRRAVEADSRALFDWRNDPTTREGSVSTDVVEWPQHETWFRASLANPSRRIYIAEIDGSVESRVGMCRFDRDGDDAEVSINLNPAFRGRGISGAVLRAAIDAYRESEHPVGLIARIRPQNVASVRLFKSAGFVRTRRDLDVDWFSA